MKLVWVLLVIGSLLDLCFIASYYQKKTGRVLLFKTASSVCFVLMGLVLALIHPDDGLDVLIVLGLVFGLLGDFFLDAGPVFRRIEKSAFLYGFAAFFVGHVFYIAHSMSMIIGCGQSVLIVYALLGCLIGALIVWRLLKVVRPPKEIKNLGIAYLLTLDFSFALAAGMLMCGIGSIWMAVGTLCFAVSDHMLVYDYYGVSRIPWFHGVLLVLYYAAQCLIAFSIIG